jgi:hypothetical protein
MIFIWDYRTLGKKLQENFREIQSQKPHPCKNRKDAAPKFKDRNANVRTLKLHRAISEGASVAGSDASARQARRS